MTSVTNGQILYDSTSIRSLEESDSLEQKVGGGHLGLGEGDGQKNDLNSLFKRVIWSTHGVGAKLPRQKKKKKA